MDKTMRTQNILLKEKHKYLGDFSTKHSVGKQHSNATTAHKLPAFQLTQSEIRSLIEEIIG
jgi:hypothetical protein